MITGPIKKNTIRSYGSVSSPSRRDHGNLELEEPMGASFRGFLAGIANGRKSGLLAFDVAATTRRMNGSDRPL
jgi:hypothetical protein